MKNVPPTGEMPAHVQVARFGANKEMKEAGIQDAYGVMHFPEHMTDPEKRYPGDVVAVELMFEVSPEEILTLMHEPYVTVTMLTDTLPPTMVQTSHPYSPKLKMMVEHTHRCPECEKPWRCQNPLHKMPESRKMLCDACWHSAQDEMVKAKEPEVDESPEDAVDS